MFITFEGIDGSGKSTQARLLYEYIMLRRENVSITGEPFGGDVISEELRGILVEGSLEPFTELCLFCADRTQHLTKWVKPLLDRGYMVICDRYVDSTIVYSHNGRGLGKQLVDDLVQTSTCGVMPDLTFWINTPLDEALSRVMRRGAVTGLDVESEDFRRRLWEGYQDRADIFGDRIVEIDGEGSIEDIHIQIRKHVDQHC